MVAGAGHAEGDGAGSQRGEDVGAIDGEARGARRDGGAAAVGAADRGDALAARHSPASPTMRAAAASCAAVTA